uniref:Transposase n=2 Tax=Musca domestica TaxID=7370 RepID=Q25442_MUSDO|nr:transposase [Musca domestica]
MQKMDNLEVKAKINQGLYKITPRHKGTSFIWNVLADIQKEDDTLVEGWVFCRKCEKVLKYTTRQTSNLCRHKCCASLKQSRELKTVSADCKKEAIEKCAQWVVRDCRPFSAVSGSGFIDMIKFFIKVGAEYGEHVNVEELLPSPITLSRKVTSDAKEKKALISREIKSAVEKDGASATIDLWTDNYIKRNFLGVTLHYHENNELRDLILGLKSLDFERSTAENIYKKLKAIFLQFNVEDLSSIKFVTDRGANVVKSLANNIRINCSSHLLSNVLENSFEETPELNVPILACKNIVKYFKKANLQHRLRSSLKSECPTRWNSTYTMLRSILDNWESVIQILSEAGETQRIVHINKSIIQTMVNILDGFERIFKELQTCSSPSLCFVVPSILKVKEICSPDVGDVADIAKLKVNIIKNVRIIWEENLSIWHYTAFFFYPPALHMQQEKVAQIKEFCLSKMEDLELINRMSSFNELSATQLNQSDSNSHNSIDLTSHSKDISTTSFFFPQLTQNNSREPPVCPSDEFEFYRKEIVILSEDFKVMEWWNLNSKKYPKLSKLALSLLSIPASSAASERTFSLAGNIITEKRNRIGQQTVDSLLFLNSFYKNFCKLDI